MRFVKSRNGSTRFLHVSGAGSSLGTSEESIREVFCIYGPVDVVLVEGRRFCFIVYQGMNATIWLFSLILLLHVKLQNSIIDR